MKLAITLGYVSGVVLIMSGFAHALAGWPALAAALGDAGVDADLRGALAAGWYFGSVCMFVFAGIVLSSTRQTQRGAADSLAGVWTIAVGYVVFGVGAFLLRERNPHFLLFVLTGLLVGGYALAASRTVADRSVVYRD